MKYKSIRGMEFENIMACALDNQTNQFKFMNLWRFLYDFDMSARDEWERKRDISFSLEYIVQALISIDVLK